MKRNETVYYPGRHPKIRDTYAFVRANRITRPLSLMLGDSTELLDFISSGDLDRMPRLFKSIYLFTT